MVTYGIYDKLMHLYQPATKCSKIDRNISPYYLPYISMEWRNIRENLGDSCPDIQGIVNALFSNSYTPYRLHGNGVKDQGVLETLEMIERDNILVKKMSDVLKVHNDAPDLLNLSASLSNY